jgi:protein-L-isoaspartate(D-aspartate) O-methyltransferase
MRHEMNDSSDPGQIAALQNALAEKLTSDGYIISQSIGRAFRAVPRHFFAPGVPLEKVYSDSSIPTKRIDGKVVSSSSQPAMMAIMLEQLQLEPGQRVLEIGAGTGYNAGLLQHLVGRSGLVVTMDIDEEIVAGAREHLRSAGIDSVIVVCGDGGLGCAEYAPYDRIILTVGAWDIVPAWWDQLKPGGRLLLPLDIKAGIQKSVAFDRADGHLESVSVRDCSFMTLRGAFAGPNSLSVLPLGQEPGTSISVGGGLKVDKDWVYDLLCGPGEDLPSGVYARPAEVIFGGLALWLSLREAGLCTLSANDQAAGQGLVPQFLDIPSVPRIFATIGLIGDEGLCVFVRPPDVPPSEQPDASQPIELFVRSYGSAMETTRRLVDQTRAWNAAGRPSSSGLRIRAYPKDTGYTPSTDEFVLPKQHTRIVLNWE